LAASVKEGGSLLFPDAVSFFPMPFRFHVYMFRPPCLNPSDEPGIEHD
jgi:hypothetical protein